MDSPPHRDFSVIDSTSNRLAGLDLVMGDMDSNSVWEVPDTPERLAARRCGGNAANEGSNPSASMGPPRRGSFWSSNSRPGNEGSSVESVDGLDTESLFRKARLASQLCTQSRVSCPQFPSSSIDPFQEMPASLLKPCQTSSGSKDGKSLKVDDARYRTTLCTSHPTKCRSNRRNLGKDICNDDHSDFFHEIIEEGSSPQPQPIRRSRSSVVSKFPNCTFPVDKSDDTVEELNSCSKLRHEEEQVSARPLKLDGPPKVTGKRMLVRNGYIAPSNISKDSTARVDRGKGKLFADGTGRDTGKRNDSPADSAIETECSISNSSNVGAYSRNTTQKKLVRNGCISPSNVTGGNIAGNGKKDGINKPHCFENLHRSSSPQIQIPSSHTEGTGHEKGKNILRSHPAEQVNPKSRSSSSRLGVVHDRDSALSGDVHDGASWFVQDSGWKTTRNRNERVSNGVIKIKDVAGNSSAQVHEDLEKSREFIDDVHGDTNINSFKAISSLSHELTSRPVMVSSNVNPESRPGDTASQKLTKGKRKTRSGRSYVGESSSAELSDNLFFSPQRLPSNTLLTRTSDSQQQQVSSIIDVDELSSPEIRHRSPENGSSMVSDNLARDLQVESDEMLARQLQEQLFNESPVFGGGEEIDASIAYTLQQEEDVHHSSSMRNRRQSQPRDPSVAHLYRNYPRHSSQNSSGRLQTHARTRASQLRRNLNRRHMDLDSRLNYLEALEAVFENRNDTTLSNSLLHFQRDFNENDYEMLLALDNDNHHHIGASLHQINSLPVSVVQTEKLEEACAVCLETPAVGDTIRHLPCLHKFHKDCIDPWLQRKTSCPICKSSIT